MTRVSLACFASAIALGATVAAQAASFDPVYIRTPFGVEGNGARFAVGEKCMTVTAWHVIEGTSQPSISPIRSPEDLALVVKTRSGMDVGLARQDNPQSRTCAPFPTDEAIRDALLGTQREVWYVTMNKDAVIVKVDLVGYTDTELQLQISPNAAPGRPSNFIPGMSGGLVVFNGVPVATLKWLATASPTAAATRLDYIKREFGEELVTRTPQPMPQRKYAPFAVEQLPADYQLIVKQARSNRSRAEAIARDAEANKRKAEDASFIAQKNTKGVVVSGYAHFDSDSSPNYYAGQVYQVGVRFGSQGFGVAEVVKGAAVGTKNYCRFMRDTGCEGPGVIVYGTNDANKSNYATLQGNFADGKPVGLGHIVWKTGAETWSGANPEPAAPGVWKTDDGRTYEGEIAANWNGKGVLWDKDGALIAFGIYNAGNLVTKVGGRP
jgi:hypothetical protein